MAAIAGEYTTLDYPTPPVSRPSLSTPRRPERWALAVPGLWLAASQSRMAEVCGWRRRCLLGLQAAAADRARDRLQAGTLGVAAAGQEPARSAPHGATALAWIFAAANSTPLRSAILDRGVSARPRRSRPVRGLPEILQAGAGPWKWRILTVATSTFVPRHFAKARPRSRNLPQVRPRGHRPSGPFQVRALLLGTCGQGVEFLADRGRDGDCSPPPAQIPASGTTALGSYLGWVTAKRCSG
jgi:hypothetical protein